jgi:hypothetical protein
MIPTKFNFSCKSIGAMDTVEEKFARFKQFVEQNAPTGFNPMLSVFMTLSLENFLDLVRTQAGDGAEEDILKKILEKLTSNGINFSEYSTEAVEKFTRYVRYFLEVSRVTG